MAQRKQKAVFTAEAGQLDVIEGLVTSGRYRSASEFLREAIDEKLKRIRRQRLDEQVARFCAGGHGDEDEGLLGAQAFDEEN